MCVCVCVYVLYVVRECVRERERVCVCVRACLRACARAHVRVCMPVSKTELLTMSSYSTHNSGSLLTVLIFTFNQIESAEEEDFTDAEQTGRYRTMNKDHPPRTLHTVH